MQGASNFKPFAVLAAVRSGVSTKTKFDGDQPQDIDGTTITTSAAAPTAWSTCAG